jgi:hypothetical protein
VGQLFDYRFHWDLSPEKPLMRVLFSEWIGEDYVNFLESLQIGSVTWAEGHWEASSLAREWGL